VSREDDCRWRGGGMGERVEEECVPIYGFEIVFPESISVDFGDLG
jgi:hypothetical protein